MTTRIEFRGVLAVEDAPTVDGRVIAGNALTWKSLPVRVIEDCEVIGEVWDVTRWGQAILCAGTLNRIPKHLKLEIDLDQTDVEYGDTVLVFKRCQLLSVRLGSNPAFPSARITWLSYIDEDDL